MAYTQVKYGSTGGDVSKLQELLKNNGYADLAVDGNFGPNTQAAVKDYQQKNGLAVDGIVGTNTWGALTKAQTPAAQAPAQTTPATPQQEAPKFEYTPYQPSETVAQAEALLQQQMANKPGAYQSTWEGQLNDTIAQILNREKFSYDLNGDALYQQMKDQYVNQGKLAMMDTMGQAAAMTGGYGNSYAQSVGQQAYQGYLQQLNDKVPELYGMALDQYNQEGQAMYDQASLLAGMEDQEYGRYMDQLTNYYTELGLARDEARYQAELDYNKWADHLNFTYGQYRDSVEDTRYDTQYKDNQKNEAFNRITSLISVGYRPTDEELAAAGMTRAQADAIVSGVGAGSSAGSRSSVSNNTSSRSNQTYTTKPESPVNNPVNNNTATVSDSIKSKAAGFTDNTDLANYLDGLVASGTITEEQADALYAENKQVDRAALKDRSWTLKDGGGVNWFWGIDNNATVKDQYDNTYRLDKLVDALVAEGMSKDEAKKYVKNLQAKLGA